MLKAGVVLLAAMAAGCGSDGAENPEPEAPEGKCFARVDGATVDIIDITDVAAGASMNGSTLHLGCGMNTGNGAKQVLEFAIKAFEGPRIYTLDETDTFGEATYNGNDGNPYYTVDQDRQSSCTIEVTDSSDESVKGTFSCTDLGAYINDPQGACCDIIYVNLTEGAFDLPL